MKLSFKEVRQVGENCTLNFIYNRNNKRRESRIYTLWASFGSGGVSVRGFDVPQSVASASTRFITSNYITNTIALSSSTSSLLSSLSLLRNSTMKSTQKRLVMLVVVN